MRTSLVLVFSLSYETFIVIMYTSTEHTPSPRMCTCSVQFIKLSITRDLCELGLEGVPQFKDGTQFQNHYFVFDTDIFDLPDNHPEYNIFKHSLCSWPGIKIIIILTS